MSHTNPPPIPVPPVEELRAAAMRLTAELDQAHFHRSAAYVSLAVEGLEKEPDLAVNDNVYRSDVECEFEIDEHDRVWMIRDGDCHIIGRKDLYPNRDVAVPPDDAGGAVLAGGLSRRGRCGRARPLR